MQFVAASGDITVVVRTVIPAIYNDKGQMLHPQKQRLFAKFRKGIPTPFIPAAMEKFQSWDRPERPLALHGGFFDSKTEAENWGWSDEELALVEEKLLARPQILRVELPKAGVPYPTYLKHRNLKGKRTIEHVLKDILATLEATGIDPDAVVRYETDHPDENSEAIIAAVTALPEPDEEELVAA
jgi:hypothetical protein